jgi:hypothetical protein
MMRRRAHSTWWLVGCIQVLALLFASATGFAQPKPKGRDISGTVVDIDNKPVANATVAVAGGPTATTAADGTFKLAGVATTNLTLDVTADGFTAKQTPVLGAATPLAVQIVLVKPPPPAGAETRMVAGVVGDGKRVPIAGAKVTVRGTALSTTTAPDGTFFIPGVASTEVTLDVEVPGQPATSIAVPADKAAVAITVGQADAGTGG